MNVNPMQLILQPMIQSMMGKFQGNPMFQQAQQMAQGKSPEQLKQTCMNICKNKGIDFEQAWSQFQTQFQSQIPGLK